MPPAFRLDGANTMPPVRRHRIGDQMPAVHHPDPTPAAIALCRDLVAEAPVDCLPRNPVRASHFSSQDYLGFIRVINTHKVRVNSLSNGTTRHRVWTQGLGQPNKVIAKFFSSVLAREGPYDKDKTYVGTILLDSRVYYFLVLLDSS